MVGIGMNLDHEAVGAGGQRGQGHGGNILALARAVAGVDEDGQVRELFDRRNDREIERVAAVIGKSPHAPLAENHLVVASGKDVFGRHQPFFERGRHAPLEQDRLPRLETRRSKL